MHNFILRFIGLSIISIILGCTKTSEPKLFELLSSQHTSIQFSNNISGQDTITVIDFEYLYNGGGVAIGDINNDGLADIYFTGNLVGNKLYLNEGNFKFKDITNTAGVNAHDIWSTGASMIDINRDGLLDIYVCAGNATSHSSSANKLYINQGDNTFQDEAPAYGLADTSYITQAAFFDFDKDNDLDLYLLTNAVEKVIPNSNLQPKKVDGSAMSTDKFFINNGDNTFTNISDAANILKEGSGLGVAISDINNDGWLDIYCANDFISNDLMWINNGDGTFSDKAPEWLQHQTFSGMGTDIADFNNDGLQDIFVLDMLPESSQRQKSMARRTNFNTFTISKELGYQAQYIRNTLQLNNGQAPDGQWSFSEIAQLAGIFKTDWSWSSLFADFDNDGNKDLFITNGYLKDLTNRDYNVYKSKSTLFGSQEVREERQQKLVMKLPTIKPHNYMYKNEGDLTFSDESVSWGFEQPTYSNGAAYADLDNDGDLDLVINNIDEHAMVYKNLTRETETGENNYLGIQLIPLEKSTSIGSKITIYYTEDNKLRKQYREYSVVRGYQSSMENRVHFGLGKAQKVDSMTINWPHGITQRLSDVEVNHSMIIEQDTAGIDRHLQKTKSQPIFTEVAADYGLKYLHSENRYVDFSRNPLLPHQFSQGGPALAVGDINGDGLQDVYSGGAAGRAGNIFLQNQNKHGFETKAFPYDAKYEDMGALLFDADNDDDLDLYVVSGGSEFRSNTVMYQDRLYLNDGKGNFSKTNDALPEMKTSGSMVKAADYDLDGDLDLFVGGRVKPSAYPMPPRSYLLENQGGKFIDATKEVAKGLAECGMVNDALWTDFNNDGLKDLIVVGEWMPVTCYKNEHGKLVNVTNTTGLADTQGWWNSLASADFDDDGDIDYLAGNLGLNTRFKASKEQPVSVYAADFDFNGTIDPLIFYYVMGENVPAFPRDAVINKVPMFRKMFPRYSSYAKATFEDFYSEQLKDAYTAKANIMASCYIENLGNGSFDIRPLPVRAQFAPIFGMETGDFNHDGHVDLLIAGNSHATEILTGWYDASIGAFMAGNGQGDFQYVSPQASGFFVNTDAKAMVSLPDANENRLILVTSNSDSLKVFKSRDSKTSAVKLKPMDAYAMITMKNGAQRKKEFHYGSTYLSQSSRILFVDEMVEKIEIVNYEGKSRLINISSKRHM